ncbi:protein ACCELERATED CELL DEATH 6-like isoform X2 [Rhodamnia argentea]|uniref:Protein ACCELERATED CELL DEATH 6-like isoform X2 n=1 Tax=Rhodamnia argentea TaxID=178133 RepID=A0A8B8QSH3_9MYRT|nr:protein ACCELERATED CELL DEATH 6-like isoform X2 [Rhodamnia argentea]
MAVEISLQGSDLWRHRLQRLEAMLTQESVSCDEKTTRELFTAAKQGDADGFIRVVERYRSESNLRLCLWVILSPSRNTLLHIAAALERDEILRAIVNHFPNQLVAGQNCRGDNALHFAARAGRVPATQVLIGRASDTGGGEMRRALLQVRNDRGNTPLHEAVVKGHLEVVRILIDEDLQPMYLENKEGKCPISVDVESGNLEVLRLLLAVPLDPSRIQGVSPVHAAVLHGNLAYINYCNGTKFLLENFTSSAIEYDRDGHFPIHLACKEGHVQAIKELLRQWPDPTELINRHGQNILHVCAKHGRIRAVKYILGNADLEKLINERDNDGNTPLHLATLPWHPVVLLDLVLDGRVDRGLLNNERLTALDLATEQIKRRDTTLQKRLASMILKSSGAPTSKDLAIYKSGNREMMAEYIVLALQNGGILRKQMNVRLIIATLVATVTFAAGLAVPGGFIESSEANPGTATMLNRGMFHAFVICNTIAMFSAMGVVVLLSWTQINDSYVALTSHIIAIKWLFISLGTMSVAFMAGGYLLVCKLPWLGSLVLLIGCSAIYHNCSMYMAMYVPFVVNTPYVRRIAFYIIRAGIAISRILDVFPEVLQDEDSPPAGMSGTRTMVTLNVNRQATLP